MWHLRGKAKCAQCFVRKPEGKRSLEDLDIDGRIVLKLILKLVRVEWTGLIREDWEVWRTVLSAVMKLWVP